MLPPQLIDPCVFIVSDEYEVLNLMFPFELLTGVVFFSSLKKENRICALASLSSEMSLREGHKNKRLSLSSR